MIEDNKQETTNETHEFKIKIHKFTLHMAMKCFDKMIDDLPKGSVEMKMLDRLMLALNKAEEIKTTGEEK